MELDNAETGATAGVTVNGLTSDTVNDIGNDAAVRIYSNGAITVSNLKSQYSLDQGLLLTIHPSRRDSRRHPDGVDLRYNNRGRDDAIFQRGGQDHQPLCSATRPAGAGCRSTLPAR